MYETDSRVQTVADAAAQQKPLTLHITDQQQSSTNTAMEIRSRLWALRDRLFGPPPASAEAANMSGAKALPNSFSDAAREGGYHLASVINDIDNLTAELANRL